MRVFVTGGAGFIGSNLVKGLLDEGHEVKVLDNLCTGRIENIDPFRLHHRFEFVQESVALRAPVWELTEWADHVYHLAAPVGVKYIMDNPVTTILDNVRGIDNILEAAHTFKKRVMVASTSEVYGRSLDLLDSTHLRSYRKMITESKAAPNTIVGHTPTPRQWTNSLHWPISSNLERRL